MASGRRHDSTANITEDRMIQDRRPHAKRRVQYAPIRSSVLGQRPLSWVLRAEGPDTLQ
jgi:hypothetical protein